MGNMILLLLENTTPEKHENEAENMENFELSFLFALCTIQTVVRANISYYYYGSLSSTARSVRVERFCSLLL